MGEIILSQAGRVAGAASLPNGLNLFGAQLSGGAIGAALGSFAGRAIDSALAPTAEGSRLTSLRIMESREGAGIANVYGRMRVGGQVIWASRFLEKRKERSAGKGGPKLADYRYSVSFAVAIAEGAITRLGRVWANGEVLPLNAYNCRLYKGSEDQLADPLIEAIEGEGNAPAYRGVAYIVFEDLPLDAFGNRLPQLSFEIIRSSDASGGLRKKVRGVNIIPASGEFVYATNIVRERSFPGIERALNMNNGAGDPDFACSLEQLSDELPNTARAALTVAWFGDDLRAGDCRIMPGVETRERDTVPYDWSVGGTSREGARLISQTGEQPNYGGTPADRAVVDAITAMKAQGLAVTLSPFLLMDIPQANALPDPYGGAEQASFPWRGRMTVTADGTASARDEIEAFLGTDDDFGFRHFILHHARLVEEAGGVEAILIGSEMVALTRIRDEAGAFPFVGGLVQLAAEVKAIVGAGTRVSYAADWTEYGAYSPAGGSGDVLFPMDELWASASVDFVGVDWYPPTGDWRSGNNHLDAQAGHQGPDDPAYIMSQIEGGEAFDWYYASPADRAAQVRTPILDNAHQEHWVFRQKDISGWWAETHHERPSGVRGAAPTDWSAGMKPVRLMEIGFPAVDKGTNAPNLFHDPKSSESALPPFSSGARNDILQRRSLETVLDHWQAENFVDAVFVWAWDGRPWPDFPARETIWSDGPNWQLGHWLNGRTGLISLSDVVTDLGERAGVSLVADGLPGLVEGFVLDGPMALRHALEPLQALHGFICREREDSLVIVQGEDHPVLLIGQSNLAETAPSLTRNLLDKRPGRLELAFVNGDGSYEPVIIDARSEAGDAGYSISASLPLVLSEAVAEAAAQTLLAATLDADTAELHLPPDYLGLEPGDRLEIEGIAGNWTISDVTDDGIRRRLSLTRPIEGQHVLSVSSTDVSAPAVFTAEPELVLIDGPALAGATGKGPLVAASGDPWGGPVSVKAGRSAAMLRERAIVSVPARIGRLLDPLMKGPHARWDRASRLRLDLRGADLASATEEAVLAGANRMLVLTDLGWELIGFQAAELQGDGVWVLSRLLRGLRGSAPGAAEAGAVCVLIDAAIVEADVETDESGVGMLWRVGDGRVQEFVYQNVAGLAWSVTQLRAVREPSGDLALSWLPRGRDIPDNWDLPDPPRARSYEILATGGGQPALVKTSNAPSLIIAGLYDLVQVAEIGTDGRRGRWVSIGVGPP